ncbi:hypothetical protein [Jeongeupia chitinilytica]|uniref:Uncharacterized protein n=1 Tax=Jeongeupia chitinilytica TaxID=1041641 RepID=A0ABQ3H1H5_9NEIS|nr:hypothetical protein [Jeongeupia chitinilytica]GHD60334.1 hypothetical protein GCM10007350_13210 [Jeongeupia chitinilytica]
MVEKMLDGPAAIKTLENWARWSQSVPSRGYAACSYMTPEEKIQAGATSRPNSVDEAVAIRVDAVVVGLPESTRNLLRRHYLLRDNPKWICRRLRLALVDYPEHVARAEEVFRMRWNYLLSTPTKAIRYLSLNNSTTLRRDSTRERVFSLA